MQYDLGLSQRWRDARQRFVPPESRIDPREFAVESISYNQAKAILATHHYLGTCPVPTRAFGLYRKTGVQRSHLVGCAVFGMAGPSTIQARTGLGPEEGLELTRFLLTDEVAFNGETHFLAKTRAELRRNSPSIRVVVAHSDPTPRLSRSGEQVFGGHVGQIYAASSAIYVGRAAPRRVYLTQNGDVVPDRLFSKIRRDGRGADSGEQRLVTLGAPPRNPGEDRTAWLTRALQEAPWRRAVHKGVHAYLFPQDRKIGSSLAGRAVTRIPYPKRLDAPLQGSPPFPGLASH